MNAPLEPSQHATSNAVCIVNSQARSGMAGDTADRVRAILRTFGDIPLEQGSSGPNLERLAKAAVDRGCRLILAGGGDGTINTIANATVGTETALAVLPLGTLNHFAKDLHIPLELDEAIRNAFTGIHECVDVGEVNGKIFLNNSSIGLYPGIVMQREAYQQEGHGKWTAFVRALAFMLGHYSALTAKLEFDRDRKLETTTPFIFVGNNRYEIKMPLLGQRPSLTGGTLWACRAPHATRVTLLKAAFKALAGRGDIVELAEFEGTEFWVRTRRKSLRVALDGEVVRMSSPLHYRIRPRALKVIVPAS